MIKTVMDPWSGQWEKRTPEFELSQYKFGGRRVIIRCVGNLILHLRYPLSCIVTVATSFILSLPHRHCVAEQWALFLTGSVTPSTFSMMMSYRELSIQIPSASTSGKTVQWAQQPHMTVELFHQSTHEICLDLLNVAAEPNSTPQLQSCIQDTDAFSSRNPSATRSMQNSILRSRHNNTNNNNYANLYGAVTRPYRYKVALQKSWWTNVILAWN